MAITDWPKDERPREKLLKRGPTVLSDAELLAIFLRTGCAGLSAVDLARNLLSRFQGLRGLLEASHGEFCAAQGLGDAKYALLQATLEMSRRHLAENLNQGIEFDNTSTVKRYLLSKLRHLKQEVFCVLLLDNQHRLIRFEELSRGTIDSASVYPREVLRCALSYNASAIIFTHNHPSGVAEPSAADKQLTEHLVKALELVDIRVLDHFVVGESVVSFAERGWI